MEAEGSVDFGAFVAATQGRLQRTAWLLTGNWEEAEDLVQTALAKAWRHWDRVVTADSPEAYARRILSNSFLSSRRRRWWGERPVSEVEPVPSGDQSEQVALRAAIEAGLKQLTARQRAAVVLRYFSDLSEAEVAEIMHCRVGTVKSTTARAFELLRAQPGFDGLLREAHL